MATLRPEHLLADLEFDELQAFARRADWCTWESTRSEAELREYLHRATASSLGNRHGISETELVGFLREEVLGPGAYTTETRLKKFLEDVSLSSAVQFVDQKELFLCGQIYGALREAFDTERFVVDQEHAIDDDLRIDLYIEDTQTDAQYIIEAKIDGNLSSVGRDVRDRVRTYQDALSQHEQSYILVFFFDDSYWLSQQGTQVTISDLWSEHHREQADQVPNSTLIKRVLPPDWK
jgi:hypothetical protein